MNSLLPHTMLVDCLVVAAQTTTPTPWFDPSIGGWIGAAIGVFGGVYGTLLGLLGPRGAAKGFMYALHGLGIAAGAILVLIAITAYLSAQPWAVWYGFGLPGVILTIVLLALTPVLLARYREAEHRRLEAAGFLREP